PGDDRAPRARSERGGRARSRARARDRLALPRAGLARAARRARDRRRAVVGHGAAVARLPRRREPDRVGLAKCAARRRGRPRGGARGLPRAPRSGGDPRAARAMIASLLLAAVAGGNLARWGDVEVAGPVRDLVVSLGSAGEARLVGRLLPGERERIAVPLP